MQLTKMMSSLEVSKAIGINRKTVQLAMDQFVQSDHDRGLRFVVFGSQRRTRESWVNEWLEEESERACL